MTDQETTEKLVELRSSDENISVEIDSDHASVQFGRDIGDRVTVTRKAAKQLLEVLELALEEEGGSAE